VAGFLCYYEGETLPDNPADVRKPRGVLNLKEENIRFSMHPHHRNDHPPTEFVFQISGQNEQQKWKMCAPNREELDKWTAALTKILGKQRP
jgi:hypothetical protein